MRRAQLSNEFLIKLLIGAAMLAFVVFLGFQLVQLFSNGTKDYAAKRNLHILADRIEAVQKDDLSGVEASIILGLPENRAIVGFDKDQEYIEFEKGSWYNPKDGRTDNTRIKHPPRCRAGFLGRLMGGTGAEACLCAIKLENIDTGLFKEQYVQAEVIECRVLDAETVAGTIKDSEVHVGLWDAFWNANIHNKQKNPNPWSVPTYTFFLSGADGPQNILIQQSDEDLLLSQQLLTAKPKFGGGASDGGGASSDW